MSPKPPSSTHVLPGDPPVEVVLRRNRRARRFSLRVSRADGRVSLSLPFWAPEDEALAFLHDRADWVRRHLDRAPPRLQARIGAEVPVCGVPRPVVAGEGRAARFVDGRIAVPPGPREGPRLKALLTALARERLARAVSVHAGAIGRSAGRLTLRDPRSRWGSCSARGDLMFSWRLIMAPAPVLDYVAAHEVAHLAEMNHGPGFWKLCRALCPETDTHRTWLRAHGNDLLAWRFDGEAEG
ncbi:SprT family zinc-dependent metalloprotease [Roseibacterium sp. SDUM158017]|uniref:M48 family metallopeptidase n=1 Tax=Roseicyclus salinarum TaxID=3036773 RepID=UPI0024154FDE|nr:SprT family zinc-dependent metalloprotease [Roseibacterium sp. SDUM158017]MDG4649919.1 SprT family zinc-dependent metalloprotease [Roseibacterium sp. SDUM158017]